MARQLSTTSGYDWSGDTVKHESMRTQGVGCAFTAAPEGSLTGVTTPEIYRDIYKTVTVAASW